MMEKWHQVFVSSTYRDLLEERQEIIQALLELDCIPSGMELFPAASDDQWSLIRRVIDSCDYYLVVIAGRYGSTDEEGMSFTEKEYRYALSKEKPIIAFLHREPESLPVNRCEDNELGKKRLSDFRQFAERKVVRYWTSPQELGSVVSRSIIRLIKDHPSPGWIRGDRAVDEAAAQTILRLKQRIEELEVEKAKSSETAPQGTEKLAQGEESHSIKLLVNVRIPESYSSRLFEIHVNSTWDELFAAIAPTMINEASNHSLQNQLTRFLFAKSLPQITEKLPEDFKEQEVHSPRIENDEFHTVIIQFRSLGLIAISDRQRSVRDKETYWKLTPFGDHSMAVLRAIRKSQ